MTSTLLPTSKITCFSSDSDTLSALQELEKDWRYARVDISTQQGGVEQAIELYSQYASPDLVIIQTDNIDDDLTGKLEKLAQNCSEGTAAIVIGPVNDVNLYRKLIDMGVSDYLVKPMNAEIIGEVIAKTLIEKKGVSGSRLVAFIGAKGGVGTSTIMQLMTWVVSEQLKQKTLIIDAAGGWSTLSVGLGFEPSTSLSEAVRIVKNNDADSLKRILHNLSERLSILASGSEHLLEPSVPAEDFEKLLDTLLVQNPLVFVDLSGAGEHLKNLVIRRANHTVLVSSPALPSLRLSRSLLQEIKTLRSEDLSDLSLIVNMSGLAKGNEVSAKDIQEALEMAPSATIPFDPALFSSIESETQKILKHKSAGELINQSLLPLLKNILPALNDEPEKNDKNEGIFGGFLTKLKSK